MSELDHAALWVLADRLQDQGDVRGELLALELAGARASEPSASRRLCEQAQAVRARAPEQAWPPSLSTWRGLIRGGLLVCGAWSPRRVPELPAAVDRHCRDLVVPVDPGGLGLGALAEAQAQRGVRLDGLWEQRLDTQAELLERSHELSRDAGLELAGLGLRRPLAAAEGLARVRGLHDLELGDRHPPGDLVEALTGHELRSLGVHLDSPAELEALLAACPRLDSLRLHGYAPTLHAALGLERLTRLSLFSRFSLFDPSAASPSPERLSDDLPLAGLDALTLHAPQLADLERVAAYDLRELEVYEARGDPAEVVARIAALETLEHLSLRWQHNGSIVPDALSRLPNLRSLELAGKFHGQIAAPPALERLVFGWGVTHLRVHGRVTEVQSATGTIFNVLSCVDLTDVRRLGLSATWGSVAKLDDVAAKLAAVEVLVVDGGQVQPATLDWIRQLPRLRTLVWPVLSIRQQRAVCERLAHVQLIGADVERLRQDWPPATRMDPLAARTWPRPRARFD